MDAKKLNIIKNVEINLNRTLTEEEAGNVLENSQLIQDMTQQGASKRTKCAF